MSKHRPFKQNKDIRSQLKKEWVSLTDGDVCVWELTLPESAVLAERSRRPEIDERGGHDATMATAWMLALSVHHGDETDSPRVWDDLNYLDTLSLRTRDVNRISAAFARVMGEAEDEVQAVEDFTGAAGARPTSASPSSASNNSTGSPRRSSVRTAS